MIQDHRWNFPAEQKNQLPYQELQSNKGRNENPFKISREGPTIMISSEYFTLDTLYLYKGKMAEDAVRVIIKGFALRSHKHNSNRSEDESNPQDIIRSFHFSHNFSVPQVLKCPLKLWKKRIWGRTRGLWRWYAGSMKIIGLDKTES